MQTDFMAKAAKADEKKAKTDPWPQRACFKKAAREFLDSTRLSQTEVADKLGLELTSFRNLLHLKDRRPSIDVLQKASALFGVSIVNFVGDPGGAPFDAETNLYAIPKYSFHPAAGLGTTVAPDEESSTGTHYISKARVDNRLKVNPRNLRYFDVDGDSMKPFLENGDRILVDIAALDSGFKDGIWLLRTAGGVVVKRIQMIGGGQYQASSDNPVYHPFMLDDTCQLLGRVVSIERDL